MERVNDLELRTIIELSRKVGGETAQIIHQNYFIPRYWSKHSLELHEALNKPHIDGAINWYNQRGETFKRFANRYWLRY